ncbi:hypothetical protein BH11ACT6_BH11ACT6_37530 [soil metagenome]
MDIVLGVSMTPTTVRMVLVEGEKADGATVDHDVFDIPADDPSATAPDKVVAAILGTRESATEGGHRLVATGVTWRDHAEAAALRDALTARKIDDVMLVSELHAAGALAQAVGRAVGYERTALMFLERNTATLSVVDTADGSIVKVQSHDLHTTDAVAELAGMVAGLESLESPPQGVFVVGSGVAIGAIKLQLESATSLPVSAPDEPEVALARGAALASANAPLFEASTVGLAYDRDGSEGTTAGAALAGYAAADVTQAAGIDYTGAPAALAYSEADPESQAFPAYVAADRPERPAVPEPQARKQERKPFLLVGSALTSIFVLGVTALVISLAVSIRPSVDQRPSPAESVLVPTQVPEALVPNPAPAPAPETIQAPVPVVQEAPQPQAPPRTVFVERPAPAAPAPAPAPAAPAPAPAPAPIAPPVVAPVIPAPQIVLPPPIIQLPAPRLPSIFRPPWESNNDDWTPPWRPTQTQTPKPTKTQQPEPTKTQEPEPTQTQVTQQPAVPQVPQVPQIQLPQLPQWPGSGSGSSGSSGDSGSSRGGGDGSGSSGSGDSGGSGRGGGSGESGSSGGDGLIPLWPFE